MKVTRACVGVGAALGFGYGFFAASQNIHYDEQQKEAMKIAGDVFVNLISQVFQIALKSGAFAFSAGVIGTVIDELLSSGGTKKEHISNV